MLGNGDHLLLLEIMSGICDIVNTELKSENKSFG